MNKNLTQAIDEIIQSRTFSLEAVDAIRELRKKAEGLENDLKQTCKDKEEVSLKYLKEAERYGEVVIQNNVLRGAEESLKMRERNMFQLEKEKAVSDAVSSTWIDAFHTIFRNTIVRENLSKAIPINNGSCQTIASTTEFKTTEKD